MYVSRQKNGFSAGGSAEGGASNEVLAAKQRFASRAAQWNAGCVGNAWHSQPR